MPARKPSRSRAGDGSIYQRADGKWVAQVTTGGRDARRQTKRVRPTRALALDELRRLRAEAPRATQAAPALDAFLATWLRATKPRVRPKTWRQYESIVRVHVVPALGGVPIDRLRPATIADALARLETGGASPRTRDLVVVILRAALATTVGHGIDVNPVHAAHRPRVPRRTMVVWTREDALAFLAATAGDELGDFWRLALSVGMRRGEMLALRWSDVDLAAGRLHVQHALTESGDLAEPKTTGSRRTIELPTRVTAALSARKARASAAARRPASFVFARVLDGSAPVNARLVNDRLDAAVVALNATLPEERRVPRIRVHDLRHTCATLRLQSGDHPRVVQEMLGHASVTLTLQTYSHTVLGMQREAATRFDAVL